jgi:hypothetical protein
MLIRIIEGKPQAYTAGELRRDNPNISFQAVISSETLAEHGVYSVKQTPAPKIDSLTHRHTQDVQLVDGEWTQVWQAVALPLDQQIQNLKAARGHAYTEEADPLFFKAQRGEILLTEWEAKVDEIRTRYPYPEGSI